MKAVWVDAGNDANWEKLAQHGITAEFYAANDPPEDVRRRLGESKNRKHGSGVYTAWNWIEDERGETYAEWTNGLVLQIVPSPTPSFPKVQLDHEEHDPDQILRMLRRWRELRPTTDTSWTFEGWQAGWMSDAFVKEVISHRVRLVPQLYTGDMREGYIIRYDSLACVRELTKRGFPDTLISPHYDARALPYGWDGFCFTQGRLP